MIRRYYPKDTGADFDMNELGDAPSDGRPRSSDLPQPGMRTAPLMREIARGLEKGTDGGVQRREIQGGMPAASGSSCAIRSMATAAARIRTSSSSAVITIL